MKERLMSEIKSTYRDNSESDAKDYENDMLRQKLEQEQTEKEQLASEIEELRLKGKESSKDSSLKGDSNQAGLVDQLAEEVCEYLEQAVKDQRLTSGIPHEKLNLRRNPSWVQEVKALSASFKIELLQL